MGARGHTTVEFNPATQRKLGAANALARVADDAGITLIGMAIAFVIHHPGVTAAIIGPRAMEHLEPRLTATDVTLSDEVSTDRRHRPARGQHQSRRRRLAQPGASAWRPAPVTRPSRKISATMALQMTHPLR